MVPKTLEMSHENDDLDGIKWETFVEKVGVWSKAPDFVENGFFDHLNTTKDSTDYLWYTTSLYVDETEDFLKGGSKPILMVESKGHAVHTFINQELQVSASGSGSQISYKFEAPIPFKAGKNEIAFLSMTVGLSNAGPFFEWVGAGLTSVKISGLKNGTVDLSSKSWAYKIGLEGEHHNIYKEDGAKNVKWLQISETPKNQPLTWYKAVINAPKGNEPVGIDMMYMGKGQVWINGKEIGRYWPITSSEKPSYKNKENRGNSSSMTRDANNSHTVQGSDVAVHEDSIDGKLNMSTIRSLLECIRASKSQDITKQFYNGTTRPTY